MHRGIDSLQADRAIEGYMGAGVQRGVEGHSGVWRGMQDVHNVSTIHMGIWL